MLSAQHIAKSFSGTPVLNDVSLDVEQGEVIAIIGRSGSGKSTLLRCLNHLETIDSGSISIDGTPMVTTDALGHPIYTDKATLRRLCLKMGFVFQNYNLFPHFSVLRNLSQAQEHVLHRSRAESRKVAMELLKKVGLADKAQQYPCQLSGGQQQRVAIARALALDPEILCFDEPTSALDPQLTQEVLNVIRDLAKDRRTMIVVTHEMRFAKEVADRVVFMQDGVIAAAGTPDEVMGEQRCDDVRNFMGVLGNE